jgi:hypothetical protein
MDAKRWLLVACSAFLLASCQGPLGEEYVGRGGDGEDEAGTGRPRDLILGRWGPAEAGRGGTVSVVQFTPDGGYRRMDQARGGWAVSMSADGFGEYQFLDDQTLEIRMRRGKTRVAVAVNREELVLTYPGKKPEKFHRSQVGYGGFGGRAMSSGRFIGGPVGTARVRFGTAPAAPAPRRARVGR